MERMERAVTTVATPVGVLYGFAPVQTEAMVALLTRRLCPLGRVDRLGRA